MLLGTAVIVVLPPRLTLAGSADAVPLPSLVTVMVYVGRSISIAETSVFAVTFLTV